MDLMVDQPGYQLRFSDDGSLLLCIGKAVNMLDVKKRRWLWTNRSLKNPSEGSISPDQSMIAIKDTSGRITLLKTRTGDVLRDLNSESDGEGCEVHFSPDGLQLIDGSWNGSLSARGCKTGALKFRQEFALEMIERISHDAARTTWLIVHHAKQNPVMPPSKKPSKAYIDIRKWPFAASEEQVHRPSRHIGEVTLNPSGKTYCFSQVLPTRRLCIAKTNSHAIVCRGRPIENDRIRDLVWSQGGEIIAAVQRHAGFVFYRSSDLAVIGKVPAKYTSSVAFSPSNEDVALGTWNETAIVALKDILMGNVRLS